MIPRTHLDAVLAVYKDHGVRGRCTLEGTCMAPLMREGDTLLVDYRPFIPRIGDVVVLRFADALRVQRVIAKDAPGSVRVSGDASQANPILVPSTDVIGRVVQVRAEGCRMQLDSVPCRVLGRALAWRAAHFSGPPPKAWYLRPLSMIHGLRTRLFPGVPSMTRLALARFRVIAERQCSNGRTSEGVMP